MKNKTIDNLSNEDGAILITIALFMLAAGIAVAAYAYTSKVRLQDKRQAQIEEQYATIMGAMSKYVARNQGYKPCPAPIAVDETSANFGLETECDTAIPPGSSVTPGAGATACNIAGAELMRYCVYNNGTRRIRFGIVPYKALKIDKEDIIDPYGNLYSYAVVEQRADGVNSPSSPADYNLITINETLLEYDVPTTSWVANNYVRTSDMVVYSHGLDGRGSWLPSGIANPASPAIPVNPAGCNGAGFDVENCDNDDVFNIALRSDVVGANYFDDTVERDITAWAYIWNDSDDVATGEIGIYNQGLKGSGVGTADPQEDFHVVGGNIRVEADASVIPQPASSLASPPIPDDIKPTGSVVTPNYCSSTTGNCFDPGLFGAEEGSSVNASCSSDQYLRGFVNGQAECVDIIPNLNLNCPGGYLQGFSYSGGTYNRICGP